MKEYQHECANSQTNCWLCRFELDDLGGLSRTIAEFRLNQAHMGFLVATGRRGTPLRDSKLRSVLSVLVLNFGTWLGTPKAMQQGDF